MPVENLGATEIESVSDDETSALTVNELVYELVSNNKNGLDILIDGFVMSKLETTKTRPTTSVDIKLVEKRVQGRSLSKEGQAKSCVTLNTKDMTG